MAAAPTAGSEAFAAVVRRQGAAVVARELDVTPGAVSNWAAGRRSPGPEPRKAIVKIYAVDLSLWDAHPGTGVVPRPPTDASAPTRAGRKVSRAANGPPAASQGAPASSTARAPGDASTGASVDAETPESVARDTVRRLRKELDRLDGDEQATSRERASVATALTSATRLLARLSGALEISQSQILRSPHWGAILATVVDAVRPWPEALDAAAKALRNLGGADA